MRSPIEWDYGPAAPTSARRRSTTITSPWPSRPGKAITDHGNVDAAFGRAAKVVEATYSVPFSPRARMEPGTATVLVGEGRVDIWSGDQDPQGLLRNAARLTGIAPEHVYVHSTFQGGGYGSNGNGPQGEQAVFIANAVKGRPVKMLWTREEDWGTRHEVPADERLSPQGRRSTPTAGRSRSRCGTRRRGISATWESAGCRRRRTSCRTTGSRCTCR